MMESVVLGQHVSKAHLFWTLAFGEEILPVKDNLIHHSKYAIAMVENGIIIVGLMADVKNIQVFVEMRCEYWTEMLNHMSCLLNYTWCVNKTMPPNPGLSVKPSLC